MQILCDKYGIIIDGQGEQGVIMLLHPTATLELGVFAREDYEGQMPLMRNIKLTSCKLTLYDKLCFSYYILRWLFLSNYEQKV